jgi:hypothetical protein
LLRESAIQNGETNVEDLPDFDVIDEAPDTATPDHTGVTEDNAQQVGSNQSEASYGSLAHDAPATIWE